MIKVIIAGGRDFKDYEHLCKVCDYQLKNQTDVEIVSGKAPGADTLGERYAKERGYEIKEFPAKWGDIKDRPDWQIGINKFGKKYWKLAGLNRNEVMATYSDALIAFWDGESSGTGTMIEFAEKQGLKIKTQNY